MKNKKILVGILSASGIAMTLPAITSCSCRGNINNPEVSTKTPKKREVGAKATRTYFYITQGNINNPDETKVKLVNLKVNGAEASPVSGLIKSSADSAGNILVVFNMSLAQKQYNANTITFDLKLTNKKANTEYIVKDFEITLSSKASAVSYNTEAAKGVTFSKFPDSVGEDEDLDIEFTLAKGYEWDTTSAWDITVDGKSIKQDILDLEDYVGELIKLQEDGQECYIYVPQTLIPSNSEVEVILKSDGKVYNVNQSGIGGNVEFDPLTTIQHGTGIKTIKFKPAKYYYMHDWDVHMSNGRGGWISIKGSDQGAYLTDNDTKLALDTSKIYGDLRISALAQPKTWQVKMDETDHLKAVNVDCTYGQPVTVTVEAKDPTKYKPKKTLTFTCMDEGTGKQEMEITSTSDDGTYVIPKEFVGGNITITPEDEGQWYTVDSTGIGANVTWTGAAKAQYSDTEPYEATLKPTSAYYQIKDADWDIKRSGTSIKGEASWDKETGAFSLPGTSITGNLAISATASNATWDVTPTLPSGSHITTTTLKQAEYNTAYSATLSVDDKYFTYSIESATCTDAVSGESKDITSDVTLTPTTGADTMNLAIPAKDITGPIAITFAQKANQYSVTKTLGANLTWTSGQTGPNAATRRQSYQAVITPDTYYEVDTLTITSGGQTLDKDTDYTFDGTNLTIKGTSIIGDITIDATAKLHEYEVDIEDVDDYLYLSLPETGPQHGVAYVIPFSLKDGYSLDEGSIQCKVTGGDTLTIANGGLTLTATTAAQTIAITDPNKIVGNLKFAADVDHINIENEAGCFASVTGTGKYLQETTLTFTMNPGYAWASGKIFTEDDKATIEVDDRELTKDDIEVSTDDNVRTVKIKAGIIKSGPIVINCDECYYTASASVKSGSESIITNLSAPEYVSPLEAYDVTYNIASGYINPTATVKVGTKTLVPGDDYDIEEDGISVYGHNVTGPVVITDITALKELKWVTFDDTVQAGTTSTNAYTAKAAAGGTPTVSIKTPVTGVSLNSDKKLVVDASVTAGTTVTLQATLDGAQTIEGTVTITDTSLTVTGEHEMDVEAAEGTVNTLTASSADVTWSTTSDLISLNDIGEGKVEVSIKEAGKESGGYATVTCTSTTADGNAESVNFDLVLDTKSKLSYSIEDSKASVQMSSSTINGNLIIPGKYYDTETSSWLPVGIVGAGFATLTITNLVLLEGITYIDSAAFFRATISFQTLNIPSTVTGIGDMAFQEAQPGKSSLKTVTFASGSVLTSIGNNSFQQQDALETISLPTNIQSIGNSAFINCTALKSITIPANLTSLGNGVFTSCTSLVDVYIDSQTIATQTEDPSALFTNAETVYVKKELTQLPEFANSYIKTTFSTVGTEVGGYIPFTKY